MHKRAVPATRSPAVTQQKPGMYQITRHKRFWAILDAAGGLVCLTVYKRGAMEVVRRLQT
jgi:ribosomal protein S10